MKPLAAFLLLCSASCAASTVTNTTNEASCPVQVIRSRLHFSAVSQGFVLDIRYGNQTPVTIIGAKFSLELMDTTNDFHDTVSDLSDGTRVRVRESSTPSWDIDLLGQLVAGYRLVVKKVAFSDGTTWEDDGTMKCRWVEDIRNK